MKRFLAGAIASVLIGGLYLSWGATAQSVPVTPISVTDDLEIVSTSVDYIADLDLLVFEQILSGEAGATVPNAAGQVDGAPVLGYVFPTTLEPVDVGFGVEDGIVALAATSHPDFDDTPLWDEDGDRNYGNDGVIWHSHWVVLASDDRVPGGLSVVQFNPDTDEAILPPTNPGMPMYMDSPGFSVLTSDNTLKILVPAARLAHQLDFTFDGVAAYMQVNTSDDARPLLGVYEVYSVNSGDLSLPYTVNRR